MFVDDFVNAFRMAEAIIDYLSEGVYAIGSGAGRCLAVVLYLFAERVDISAGFRPVVVDAELPFGQGLSDQRSLEYGSARFPGATGWHAVVPLWEEIDLTVGSICSLEGLS